MTPDDVTTVAYLLGIVLGVCVGMIIGLFWDQWTDWKGWVE